MRQHHHCCHRLHRRFAKTFTSLALLLVVFASLPQPASASVTLQYPIAASTDDATKYSTTSFSTTLTEERIGTYLTVVYNDNGLRFLNVSIDSSYSLYYAKLIFTAAATQAPTKASTIYYEDNVTPATFSTLVDFNARTRGAISQAWTVPSVTAEQQYEVDITLLVASIFSNASWTSGSNMTFFWTSGTGTAPKRFYSYNGDPAKAPILEIKYKETFYLTFYYNRDYLEGAVSYREASGNTNPPNGTEFAVLEEASVQFETALNGSYVFQNYTVIGDSAYFTNPLSWTMPENFGNTTIWTYTTLTPTPTTPENTAKWLLLGAALFSPIMLAIALHQRKQRKP